MNTPAAPKPPLYLPVAADITLEEVSHLPELHRCAFGLTTPEVEWHARRLAHFLWRYAPSGTVRALCGAGARLMDSSTITIPSDPLFPADDPYPGPPERNPYAPASEEDHLVLNGVRYRLVPDTAGKEDA